MPTGTPQSSARRLDFENDSSSASRRSLTAQIAGYSALVTTSSTRAAYSEMLLARLIAPTATTPSERCATRIGTCAISTPLAELTNTAPDNLATPRGAPASRRRPGVYGDARTAASASPHAPPTVPTTRLQ